MSTETIERPDTKTDHGGTGNTDEPEFAHYARKESIADAYVFGQEVIALCGHTFVPTRDPEKFPLCPKCKEIADSLPAGPNG